MIEAYAFFAAFTVQILVLSVLQPAWLARYVRAKADVQLPGWDPTAREHFLHLYRAANAGIAALGLVLLAWLFNNTQRPGWDMGSATTPLSLYGTAQMVPFVVVSLIGTWYKRKTLLRSPLVRRTAILERRGLFDFVSPWAVFLSLSAYMLFAGFMIIVERHPIPGFAGYALLRSATITYIVFAFSLYWLLYRRKRWPLETQAYRLQAIAVQVKLIVHISFAVIAFLSLTATLRLLHLLRWMPFALSVYYVIVVLFMFTVMFVLRRQAEADRLAQNPRPIAQEI